MTMDIIEHMEREEWNNDDYVDMGIVAKAKHHIDNGMGDSNRHAIILGNDVIILEAQIPE